MPEITLTSEQTQIVDSAHEPVTVRDSHGNTVGQLRAREFSPEEIQAALDAHAKDDRCYTTAEVFSQLLLLSEAEKHKGARLVPSEVEAILRDS